jgi:hypothetical protein
MSLSIEVKSITTTGQGSFHTPLQARGSFHTHFRVWVMLIVDKYTRKWMKHDTTRNNVQIPHYCWPRCLMKLWIQRIFTERWGTLHIYSLLNRNLLVKKDVRMKTMLGSSLRVSQLQVRGHFTLHCRLGGHFTLILGYELCSLLKTLPWLWNVELQ